MRPLLPITFPQGFRFSKNFGLPILGSRSSNLKRHMELESFHWKHILKQDFPSDNLKRHMQHMLERGHLTVAVVLLD